MTALVQVVSVPLLLWAWGVVRYGDWLLLSTIPAYFGMSDIGFCLVAGNEMTMRAAREDREGSLRVFQSSWVFVSVISLALLMISVLLAWAVPFERWLNLAHTAHREAAIVLTLLLLQVLVSLQRGLMFNAHRSVGFYARAINYGNALRLAELAGMTAALWAGAGMIGLATVGLVVRSGGTVLYRRFVARDASWLVYGVSHADRTTIANLVRPALTYLGFPLSSAITLQGMVIVVGRILGPVAVVSFSTVRTLVNLVKQAPIVVNSSVWTEFSLAYGSGNLVLARKLNRYACQAALWSVIVGVAVLSLTGNWIIHHWTGGAVVMDPGFFYLMLTGVIVNALWFPSSALATSTNLHESTAVLLVAASVGSLLVASVLIPVWSLRGAALALILFEAVMTAYVIRLSLKLVQDEVGPFLQSLFSTEWVRFLWLRRPTAG